MDALLKNKQNALWLAGALLAFLSMFWVFSKSMGTLPASNDISTFVEAESVLDPLIDSSIKVRLGDKTGFQGLTQTKTALNSLTSSLKQTPEFKAIQQQVDNLLAQQKTVSDLWDNRQSIKNQLIDLQKLQEKLVLQLIPQSHSEESVLVLTRQSWLAERLIGQLEGAFWVEDIPAWTARFQRDLSLFVQVVQGLKSGDDSLRITALAVPQDVEVLSDIAKNLAQLQKNTKIFVDQLGTLSSIRQQSETLSSTAQSFMFGLNKTITKNLGASSQSGGASAFWLGVALGLTTLGCLLAFGFQMYRQLTQNVTSTSEQHQANRDSVWKLLDELSTLAEGDLTIQATIADDITGSIAESVNFAIGALRKLVVTIQETAAAVLAEVEKARVTADQLADASQKQAGQISTVTNNIHSIAESIGEVSENAKKSSEVAQNAVQLAQSSAMVVRNNLEGMDRAHSQMEATAEKIKKLGESSQEIGNIISLIDDLSDQTNIVALNAAIQAAMAGEAGRGFAVVADEIQRLAERSSQSAKQIEGLVRHIQKDVQQTVEAMEQTTTEVTTSAKLAQDAASSLERIDAISKQLAEHIQHISNAATQQAGSASDASGTMRTISEIVMQTAAGSQEAARAVGELLKMAEGLKHSVAGFKLPNKEAM